MFIKQWDLIQTMDNKANFMVPGSINILFNFNTSSVRSLTLTLTHFSGSTFCAHLIPEAANRDAKSLIAGDPVHIAKAVIE